MESILLKLGLRTNKRVIFTIIGIAICITYLVGTISIVGGLHQGTNRIAGLFEEGQAIIHEGGALSESHLPENSTERFSGIFVACKYSEASIGGVNASLISIYDPYDKIGFGLESKTDQSDVLIGVSLRDKLAAAGIDILAGTNVTVTAASGEESRLQVTGAYSEGIIFPDDWLIIPHEVMDRLAPDLKEKYSFIIVQRSERDIIDVFEGEGYEVDYTISIVDFFEGGIYQVESNLWAIIIPSSIIIALLAYSVMSIEVEYRVGEIKILNYVGATQMQVLGVFLLQALYIALLGALIGISLGIMSANALTSLTPLAGYDSWVLPQISISTIGLPLAAALLAGLIGGILPAYRASRITVKPQIKAEPEAH